MFEIKNNFEIESGSEKGFGLVFAVIFLLVGFYPAIKGGDFRFWALGIAFVFLILAFICPRALSMPNRLWFRLSLLLGSIVTPIVMTFVFFIAVVPTGLFIRFIKRDLLLQKIDKDANTYWIERKHFTNSMKDQF